MDYIKIGNKKIKGRFTIPSGIVTTTTDVIKRIADDAEEIGILTTKSIGLEARVGNPEPIFTQLDKNSFLNAVGLANPGAEEFAGELKEIYPLPKDKFLLTSIFGSTAEEFQKVATILAPYSDGLELNFSCPHAEPGYGATIGSSKELTAKFTKAVKDVISIPVVVKLTPNVNNIGEIAKAAIEAGADGITAINTVGPIESSILSYGKGGMSGRAIKETGLKCVKEISDVIKSLKKEITIVAMSGIMSANDVREYENNGADFFGIGSALTGMNTETIMLYFYLLDKDLKNNTNHAENLILKKMIMEYQPARITSIEQPAFDLKIFYFNKSISANPGQFIFTKVGKHEKPFSIADDNPLTLAVRRVGNFTSKLFELKERDEVMIRGPYGNNFYTSNYRKNCLVGGGTGLAPLHFLAKHCKDPIIFMGGKTKNQLLFKKQFMGIGKVIVATENGSEGFKGLLTDVLEYHLQSQNDNFSFYNCGPELMIKKAIEIESKFKYISIDSLIERYTKCGVGICGTCAIEGYRTCVDGPVFDARFLKRSKQFGNYKRDASGKLIPVR